MDHRRRGRSFGADSNLVPRNRPRGDSPCRGGRAVLCAVLAALVSLAEPAIGAETRPRVPPNLREALTTPAARQDAIEALPLEKLDPVARGKVRGVLSKVTAFRRMPIRVVDCDPDMYVFLSRHPDVVVNVWEVLGIGKMTLRQIGSNTYHLVDSAGMQARVEYLYHSHDKVVIYAEGTRRARLLAGDGTLIRPYVQAFLIGEELAYEEPEYFRYLKLQLQGADVADADGFTLWNASGRYYMVD